MCFPCTNSHRASALRFWSLQEQAYLHTAVMDLVKALGVNAKGKHLFCKRGGFSLGLAGDFLHN